MSEHWEKYSVTINGHLEANLKVTPAESDDGIAIVEHVLPPKKLASPLHRHSREDEISYILQGTMGVQEGEETFTVQAGEFAIKERDIWHTFWNPGTEPLRFLEIITPGEFAKYFQELAALLPEQGAPNEETMARIDDLGEEYGFESKPESVPELIERHDLER